LSLKSAGAGLSDKAATLYYRDRTPAVVLVCSDRL